MLRTLCAHPKPVVGFRSGAKELSAATIQVMEPIMEGKAAEHHFLLERAISKNCA